LVKDELNVLSLSEFISGKVSNRMVGVPVTYLFIKDVDNTEKYTLLYLGLLLDKDGVLSLLKHNFNSSSTVNCTRESKKSFTTKTNLDVFTFNNKVSVMVLSKFVPKLAKVNPVKERLSPVTAKDQKTR